MDEDSDGCLHYIRGVRGTGLVGFSWSKNRHPRLRDAFRVDLSGLMPPSFDLSISNQQGEHHTPGMLFVCFFGMCGLQLMFGPRRGVTTWLSRKPK